MRRTRSPCVCEIGGRLFELTTKMSFSLGGYFCDHNLFNQL